MFWELLKKKKKAKAKQKALEEPEQMDRVCQGRTKGSLKHQEADVSPAVVGSSPDASGQESCVSILSLQHHALCWGEVWALCHAFRYFGDGVWRAAHVWCSHCPAGALLDLQGSGGKWHENVLRKMFYYYCFCQLNFGELYKVIMGFLGASLVAQMAQISGSERSLGWLPTPLFLSGKSHG